MGGSIHSWIHRSAAAHVAKGVECAMDTNNPYFTQKEDYLGKARQLVFNLKKNDQLRCEPGK